MNLEPTALVPFVPGGSDFARSRQLFQELGFHELWDGGDYVGFAAGAAKFILQDLNLPEFASNLMIKIEVADVDAWWESMAPKKLTERYPEFRMNEPKDFPWGREVHFIDLAGVCWHVARS